MVEVINSIKNNKIKYLRKLYSNRQRKKEGKYILEGLRLIKSAVKMTAEINRIFLTPEFAGDKEINFIDTLPAGKISYISKNLMEELADTVNPQGIIAIVDEPEYEYRKFFKDNKYTLVLDRIQDPGNMGTLIRTAAAAGFSGLIALKGCVDIYNLKVIRATAGAIFSLPIINKMEFMDLKEFKEDKEDDIRLISADPGGSSYYHKVDYKAPLLLVIGNEANGIRKEILTLSDFIVRIPVSRDIDSLNAAVAGSLIMYKINGKNLL